MAVIVLLAVIPVIHFLGVPFGPFIAGYFGINAAREYPGSPGRKALTYGLWMGAVIGVITVIAATAVTVIGGFAYPFLLWGGVVVAVFYYSSMSALGAWYAGLKAAERDTPAPSQGRVSPGSAPRPTDG